MLAAAGIHLGASAPHDSRPGHDNLTGYWEHPGFQRINRALLRSAGGSWKSPPSGEAVRQLAVVPPATLATKARALLAEIAVDGPWGWKDPRNTLTLPFWAELIPGLRIVATIRDPLVVAASLEARLQGSARRRRNGLPFEEGLKLWETYNLRILEQLGSGPGVFIVHYESLIYRSREELRRVLSEIGLRVVEPILERASRLANPALSRSRPGSRDVEPHLRERLLDLYEQLSEQAGPNHLGLRQCQELPADGATTRSGSDSQARALDEDRTRSTIHDLDIAVVHYLHNRPTVAMLTALFQHYPEARVILVDNSGGRCPAEREVLPHLAEVGERIRLVVNPGRDIGAVGDLSHGAGLDHALHHCRRRYLVSMESDTFVLGRGSLEYLLELMDAGYDWAGVGQKPVGGQFASFTPSFAIFRVEVLRELGLSFRRRPRPTDMQDPDDPLIRHHRQASDRARAGLPPLYPEGKSPDTYRADRESIVQRELKHLEYFDTGEWIHRILQEKGYLGHLFPAPPSICHVWGSRFEAGFLVNFYRALPQKDINDFLPAALRVDTRLEALSFPCLDLIDERREGLSPRWCWHGSPPDRCVAQGDGIRFDLVLKPREKRYLALGGGRFSMPPSPDLGARLRGGALHKVGCRLASSRNARISLFVIEYTATERLRDHRFKLVEGGNEFWFLARPEAESFRILFRCAGRGRVALAELRLAAGSETGYSD